MRWRLAQSSAAQVGTSVQSAPRPVPRPALFPLTGAGAPFRHMHPHCAINEPHFPTDSEGHTHPVTTTWPTQRALECYPVFQYQDGSFVHPRARDTIQLIALRRPVARVHLSTRAGRISCQYLRAAFTLYVWNSQQMANITITPPCGWCGHPTGCWCDGCRAAICTAYDEQFGQCPRCARDPEYKNMPEESQGTRA